MIENTHTSDALREAARDAKREARAFGQAATEQAKQAAARQKGTIADSLAGAARALATTAAQLENEQQDVFARVAADASHRLHSLTTRLREQDLAGIRGDAERFARARPALFLGGCVAAGFALSRFLKASAERAQPEHDEPIIAADPAIGLGSETSFTEPVHEPVTSDWSGERTSQQVWKP